MTAPRTCIEEETYAQGKATLGVHVRRLDDILVGVLAKISRFPERSYPIPGTTLFSEVTAPFPDAPAVWVLFSFDDENVFLRWIALYQAGSATP